MESCLLIKGGNLVDGTGKAKRKADIRICEDAIAEIGKLEKKNEETVINAKEHVVSPGFIDMHSHSDLAIFDPNKTRAKLLQGITTEVIGNCGVSVAPLKEERKSLIKQSASVIGHLENWGWQTFADYLKNVEESDPLLNIVGLVGHGTIRSAVLGSDNRTPSKKELAQMRELVRESMREGAVGMSTGLIYVPGCYSETEELLELCEEVSRYGGIYTTHMRSESDNVLEALKESIELGQSSGVRVHISHHKAIGKENWGKSSETLGIMDKAGKEIQITCDQYPYLAGSSPLVSILPPWAREGGKEQIIMRLRSRAKRQKIKQDLERGLPGWENNWAKTVGWKNLVINFSPAFSKYEGTNLADIAENEGATPSDTLFNILIQDKCDTTMIHFSMHKKDLQNIMKAPFTMIGTDGVDSGGKPHPRLYGTFPRILGKYVRKEKVLTLEEAIRKMTLLPAQTLNLKNRGLVKEGMKADITIFDPELIEDKATYDDPRQFPHGVNWVIVNGSIAIQEGEATGIAAGKVLRY